MSISKISLAGIYSKNINIKKTENKNNVSTSTPITKSVDTKDFLFNYPITFGQARTVEKPDISFEDSLKKFFRFTPDKYQIEAAKYIYDNADPIVLAPTGTGKTLIAEYAINKNLSEGKTTFYTSPLKALSNQKYTDFCKLYGKENVGLVTGDICHNPDAPVLIMTTEIYRNILIGEDENDLNQRLDNVATVVYDEFHYMNDSDRGEVWESSIMYTPPKVQQLLLSATADNGNVIQKWMNRLLAEKSSTRKTEIVNVPEEERHVPLKYYVYNAKKAKNSIIPLIDERYSLAKLLKATLPDSKTSLTDKQKDVLSEISKKGGQDGSVDTGIKVLMKITDQAGSLDTLELALVRRLGYEPIEAERAAAILANKAEQKMNEALKGPKLTEKEKRKEYFENKAPKRLVSVQKARELAISNTVKRDVRRAFAVLSRKLKGPGTPDDGYKKIVQLMGKSDLNIGEFKTKLDSIGLKPDMVNTITDTLVITKRPEFTPVEYDLINVLEKEDKLPAIFFNFSKRQCNNLRDGFLKTGKSLLTPEEQEKAKEIIAKHVDKGVFLGTNERPETLLSGVALHHAGKMPSYKALIEELAQNKLLKVVFATSTLGAGIDVPAKTVVFTQVTRFAGENGGPNGEKFVLLSNMEFKQEAGRAGRRGKDLIGNVIVIPDMEHGPSCIYKLATSKAEAINSSFKPTYSFISHYISREGTDKTLADAVDKSFLKEDLESKGIKPYKVMNGIKKKFQAMAKVLTSPELECFENVDGKFIPTVKGKVVSKARGVDGLVFAETIFNSGIEYLTPQELAAVACSLMGGSEKEHQEPVHLEEDVCDALYGIEKLYEKIQKLQDKEKVDVKELQLNATDAQYIYQWASADSGDSRKDWENIINTNTKDIKGFNEGDFLKIVNRTIDILEQIKEVSSYVANEYANNETKQNLVFRMKKLNSKATEALKLLNRDPVEYEL